jgi:hypothetical protein
VCALGEMWWSEEWVILSEMEEMTDILLRRMYLMKQKTLISLNLDLKY